MSADESKSSVDKVADLLGSRILCTLDDGRKLEGNFECLDRLSNIILRDAVEKRCVKDPSLYGKEYCKDPDNAEGLEIERVLSQVLIPGNHLVKVELFSR